MIKIYKLILFSILFILILSSCEENNEVDESYKINFEYLKGTWIDKESYSMQFLDFYSENQARFGWYSKNFEEYDSFNYRIIDPNQLAIDLLSDNDDTEYLHDLIIIDDETMEISDLSIIPEYPNKIYLKREIITEKINDTIIIGHNQIYFDFEHDFRLQMVSVISDSRCPSGANCIWVGNAKVKLDLIPKGNYHYEFRLNTNADFQTDTIIDNIKYQLVGLIPYPSINQTIDQKDYKVKILTEEQ